MMRSRERSGVRPGGWRIGFGMLVAAASLLSWGTIAQAQTRTSSNQGALTFAGGVDFASAYVFRGLIQEQDPRLTLFPYGDLGIALGSSGRQVVNVGVWHSVNGGSSGTDGPSGHAHYEEDFYARFNRLFGRTLVVSAGYMARTSPNNMFDTEHEVQLKVARADWLKPYGFLASELSVTGQADYGVSKGTYLELGAAPTFPVGGANARLTIPARAGVSLKDYYELAGRDHRFGFVAVGAMVTLPLGRTPTRFGTWNLHGGADVFALGDTPKAAHDGKATKVVGTVGVGLTY